jgi:hypothetical protein
MMCNFVCSSMGRHVHIDYCPAEEGAPRCDGAEVQHIDSQMIPNPEKPKDAITHSLYWRRMGSSGVSFPLYSSGSVFIRRLQRSRVLYFSGQNPY